MDPIFNDTFDHLSDIRDTMQKIVKYCDEMLGTDWTQYGTPDILTDAYTKLMEDHRREAQHIIDQINELERIFNG